MSATTTDRLAELIARVVKDHEAIHRDPAAALIRALDAGDALAEIKALVKRGQWETTLETMQLPSSTARLYMQLGRNREIILAAGCTSIREARQMLSDSKPRRPSRGRSRGDERAGESSGASTGEGEGDAPRSDRYDEGYADGYRAGRADGHSTGPTPTNGKWKPSERDLKWLIRVSHPDHHQDPQEILKATRATAWLNQLLAEIRNNNPVGNR
jgi:hypothetical protein